MSDGERSVKGEGPGEARLRDAVRRVRQWLGYRELANRGIGTPCEAANSGIGTPCGSLNRGIGTPCEAANSGIGTPSEFGDPDDNAPPRRVKLLNILTTRCSAEDLRTLCFVLGVNHEVLPGTGKAARARELVAYFDRRQDLDSLVAALGSLRPDLRDELSAVSEGQQ